MTICALATAPGGALGIIRISGPRTLEILSHIFSKDLKAAAPNTIHYGHIVEYDAVLQHQVPSTKSWFPSSEPPIPTQAKMLRRSAVTAPAIY